MLIEKEDLKKELHEAILRNVSSYYYDSCEEAQEKQISIIETVNSALIKQLKYFILNQIEVDLFNDEFNKLKRIENGL